MASDLITVHLTVQGGRQKTMEIPGEFTVKEIIGEIIATMKLPVVGPDGLPLPYELFSKGLARKLNQDERLDQTGVAQGDRLELIAKTVPGAQELC